MTGKRSLVSVLVLMMAITLFAPGIVRAGDPGGKIIVRFNKPVEIPHLVLEPGTYVFKPADHGNTRNVVQVFNDNETHIYATLITIPKHRNTVSAEAVFQLEERKAGAPMAIHAWFYPGEHTGYEFVYSKEADVQSPAEPAANVTRDNTAAVPTPSEPTVPSEQTEPASQIETIERIRIIAFLVKPEEPIANDFEGPMPQ